MSWGLQQKSIFEDNLKTPKSLIDNHAKTKNVQSIVIQATKKVQIFKY